MWRIVMGVVVVVVWYGYGYGWVWGNYLMIWFDLVIDDDGSFGSVTSRRFAVDRSVGQSSRSVGQSVGQSVGHKEGKKTKCL